jgi:Animal haem peroxidase
MFAPREAFDDSDEAIDELVRLMRSRAPAAQQRENLDIPAGFTYLAQFVDHDITFDPTSKRDRRNDPHALVNFRTPRYDLDSVYGSGPTAQPYLYDDTDSTRLLVGRVAEDAPDDLPRNQQGRALIGDARNDENVIVGQLHLLFIKFHNAVVERLTGTVGGADLFEEAQRVVRWHYQWIVAHELLPVVVGADRAARALDRREHFTWEHEPFIPVEFSGAAYRFGHSLVRNQYGLRRLPADPSAPRPRAKTLFPDLVGFTWLSGDLVIDWERFFVLDGLDGQVQPSFLIDTSLAKPLFDLPHGGGELPRLNLERGRALGLPSAQEVAAAMAERPLPDEALLLDDRVPARVREALLGATPLWYYILCEAAHLEKGARLGPVGGRIVAEVLVGLLEGDPSSYLSQEPTWRPTELETGGEFSMADLVKAAQGAG